MTYHSLLAGWLADWHVWAAILSAGFSVWAMFPYIGDILRGGETKPNAVSFFLWTVCEVIALVAQVKSGASLSVVLMGLITLNTTIIFVLAVCGYGYRKYDWVDGISLFCSILAIVLWQATTNPDLAIVFAIVADFCAAIPTIKKVYREPHSEHFFGWMLIGIGCAFGALSTEILNLANLAFPAYVTGMNALILAFIYFGRKRLARAQC